MNPPRSKKDFFDGRLCASHHSVVWFVVRCDYVMFQTCMLVGERTNYCTVQYVCKGGGTPVFSEKVTSGFRNIGSFWFLSESRDHRVSVPPLQYDQTCFTLCICKYVERCDKEKIAVALVVVTEKIVIRVHRWSPTLWSCILVLKHVFQHFQ